MTNDIERKVVEVVARRKKLDPSRISMDSTFADLGIDSLDGIEILFTIEDSFDITIPDEVARRMKSVREVVEGLHDIMANRSTGTS